MLRTALAVLVVVAAAVVAGQSSDRDPSRLRAGIFLYAAPGVNDPRFEQTVVLLVEHGAEGSMGLVVNRPTDAELGPILKLDEQSGSELTLYWGGPVQPEAVHALVRSAEQGSDTRTVLADVHLTGELSEVKAALAGPDPGGRVRVYSGYAGWAKGQLAGEVRGGVWVLDRADAGSVFAAEPRKLWPRVHLLLNRLEARARLAAGFAG